MEKAITTLAELKEALVKAGEARGEKECNEIFPLIADALINRFAISKGRHTYCFAEIEFYHNCLDNPDEPEKRTYPRDTKEGSWFFHQSGVDLTFRTVNDDMGNPVRYGGILVRSLEGVEFIQGPYKVMDVLFDRFDAFSSTSPVAHIVPIHDRGITDYTVCSRYHFSKGPYCYALPMRIWSRMKATRRRIDPRTHRVVTYSYPAYPYTAGGNLAKEREL